MAEGAGVDERDLCVVESGAVVERFWLKGSNASGGGINNVERDGNKEFNQFLALAKGSCGELHSQLYVALDQGYLDKETFDGLTNMAIQIMHMVAGLMKYLRTSEIKGKKYK